MEKPLAGRIINELGRYRSMELDMLAVTLGLRTGAIMPYLKALKNQGVLSYDEHKVELSNTGF